MKKRPRIQIEWTPVDKIIEAMSLLILVVMWVFTLLRYADLPDIIPIHYNAAGIADGFGKKAHILILPVISTIFYVSFTLLNRFPHIFNFPVRITEENAYRQYANMTRMLRWLKLLILFLFGMIIWNTVRFTDNHPEGLKSWFLPVTLGLVFIPMIYYIFKSWREK